MADCAWFERIQSERPQMAHRLDEVSTDREGVTILHSACGRKFSCADGGFRQVDLSLVDTTKMCSRCVRKPQEHGLPPWPIEWSRVTERP
jgi:hypothetical protein